MSNIPDRKPAASSLPFTSTTITTKPIAALKPNPRNARTHSKKQISEIARSIKRFGFTSPVLVDGEGTILAGHGRLAAAERLGLDPVPTVCLTHLSPEDQRAYLIADNRIALNAGWNQQVLAIEFGELADLGIDLTITGFPTVEIDTIIELAGGDNIAGDTAPEDEIPAVPERAVTQPGDMWELGRHSLICGDARDTAVWGRLMGRDRARMVFCDPPYNLKIHGHVSGMGKQKHREFACASGEMNSGEYENFLFQTLDPLRDHCEDGTIAYICMDWRHIKELLNATEKIFDEYKQLIVWNKSNGGMGTFYRSKHELIFVFKVGTAPHINNFGLGESGRYRTNVWDYAGINSMSATRGEELAMHPTVKNAGMIADALKDCSNRGDIVLDMFGGSGSTLAAAHMTGRVARLIEIDGIYCDVTIARFEKLTGKQAMLVGDGRSFEEIARERLDLEEDV